MPEKRVFSERNPRCPLCGVLNQLHGVEEAAGRCDNLTPGVTAFMDGVSQLVQGNREVGLAMMDQVTEWTDTTDLEQGICPRCGELDFYIKVPRGCGACGYEETLPKNEEAS